LKKDKLLTSIEEKLKQSLEMNSNSNNSNVIIKYNLAIYYEKINNIDEAKKLHYSILKEFPTYIDSFYRYL
jgi:hypothetical protein